MTVVFDQDMTHMTIAKSKFRFSLFESRVNVLNPP